MREMIAVGGGRDEIASVALFFDLLGADDVRLCEDRNDTFSGNRTLSMCAGRTRELTREDYVDDLIFSLALTTVVDSCLPKKCDGRWLWFAVRGVRLDRSGGGAASTRSALSSFRLSCAQRHTGLEFYMI